MCKDRIADDTAIEGSWHPVITKYTRKAVCRQHCYQALPSILLSLILLALLVKEGCGSANTTGLTRALQCEDCPPYHIITKRYTISRGSEPKKRTISAMCPAGEVVYNVGYNLERGRLYGDSVSEVDTVGQNSGGAVVFWIKPASATSPSVVVSVKLACHSWIGGTLYSRSTSAETFTDDCSTISGITGSSLLYSVPGDTFPGYATSTLMAAIEAPTTVVYRGSKCRDITYRGIELKSDDPDRWFSWEARMYSLSDDRVGSEDYVLKYDCPDRTYPITVRYATPSDAIVRGQWLYYSGGAISVTPPITGNGLVRLQVLCGVGRID